MTDTGSWEKDVQSAAERLAQAHIEAGGRKLPSWQHAGFFNGIPLHLRDEVRRRSNRIVNKEMRSA